MISDALREINRIKVNEKGVKSSKKEKFKEKIGACTY